MTLNSTIIIAAFRESNMIGQASDLTSDEQTEGLQLLQSLTDSFFGLVVGTKAKPWYLPHPFNTASETANFPAAPGNPQVRNRVDQNYPPPNSRVFLRTSTAETIYFQYAPEDGAMMQIVDAGFTANVTLDGNGMFIGDTGVSYTEVIPFAAPANRVPPRTYAFRGDIASWVQTNALVYAGQNPFPSDFDDFWITSLAMRLAPRFGNMPNEVTMLRNKDMLTYIRGIYRQTEEAVGNGPARAEQAFYNGQYQDDPERGRI